MVDSVGTLWNGKSRGGRLGYLFFVYIIRRTGIGFAYFFLAFIVAYFIPFAPKSTRSVWLYNRQIRGLGILRSIQELYLHYYSFGQTLIDKVAIKGGLEKEYNFKFDNYGRFLEIINGNQGVVMIGAHVGCWETGAVFFGKYGKKMNIIMLDAEHSQIKRILDDNATKENNYKIIDIGRDSINALLQIKIGLNNGEYVCFNGDRFLNSNTTLEHTFMGKTALFPVGPFRIAAKCGTSVVFYYAVRESRRTYRFVFDEAVVEGKICYESLLTQYIRSLEKVVRSYPRQWFNFYEFWSKQTNHQ